MIATILLLWGCYAKQKLTAHQTRLMMLMGEHGGFPTSRRQDKLRKGVQVGLIDSRGRIHMVGEKSIYLLLYNKFCDM